MNIQSKIKKWIKETLRLESDFVLAHPKYIKNGDYSFFSVDENPKDLVDKLEKNKILEVDKIEVVGNFINFYLSKEFFTNSIKEILGKEERCGENDLFKDQKIIIEYTDPNPFKEFHIGHLMSNSIGEAISRIIETGGSSIKRLSYGGDVGLHVTKSIFAVLAQKNEIEKIKNADEKEQIKFWAKAYILGNNQYEDNADAKKEIDELNKIIFDKSDPEINELYEWGRELSIKYFQEMFKRLGTHFDKNIWESEVVEDAQKAVSLGLEKNVLEKSEGAVIFKGENYGLHTRVFVNSKGVPIYEAKELGLSIKKYEDFSFDKSIVITGNEQNEYFKVVLKATELIKPEVSGKTVHIGHGMLRFVSGKMSSRKGNVITGEDLIDQVKEKVFEKIKDRDFNEEDPSIDSGQVKNSIAEMVAIGAIKYSILRQAIGGDIIFDFDKSISFEGDSGPYLQYACVRANSVLEKVLKGTFKMPQSQKVPFNTLETWEITELEKYLYRFEEVVERAGVEYAPHYLVTYLTELASLFNSFYANNKIIDENDPSSSYKIALTQAVANILKSGLNLLGIKVPKKM
ncbi:MAG: arginine--tRNA ligase [Patescibacteria group bacterium]